MSHLPKPLKSNSKIALICPGGGFDDYKPIMLVVKYLKNRGFKIKLGKSLCNSKSLYKYLSGSDSNRLSDLTNNWCDDSIDAIFCLRGGYGSLRLLDKIDFNKMKKSKKIIVGFSDITALLLFVYKKLNLVTFHGPMLGIDFLNQNLTVKNKNSEKNLWKMLFNPGFEFSYSNIAYAKTICPGKARGVLLGGNLTTICSMIGTGFLPDFSNSILFIEDTNEEPYKIDRFLTQIDNSHVLGKVNGVLFSGFKNCDVKNFNSLICLLKEKVSKYRIPVLFNFPIGHGVANYIVPIGMNVTLDADNKKLYSS